MFNPSITERMTYIMRWIFTLIAIFQISNSYADAVTRIVDVGPGFCAITVIDDKHYFLFDAGHWRGGQCYDALSDMVQSNTIELMVLSHSDSDHLGDAGKILNNYSVKTIVRTGMLRSTKTWERMDRAVKEEVDYGAKEYNLQEFELIPGKLNFSLGDAKISILYGKGDWTGLSMSENRNAVSIVAKLSYSGHSILFTGDTIGRRLDDPADACKDAESAMVDLHNADEISLKSDVIIASHHGGNNGSSSCFINAVSPEFVVFPAGHDHGHPAFDTYTRYINAGVDKNKIYRTDLNDAEDDTDRDWEDESLTNCIDVAGDDDIEITMMRTGISVSYRTDGVDSECKTIQ